MNAANRTVVCDCRCVARIKEGLNSHSNSIEEMQFVTSIINPKAMAT